VSAPAELRDLTGERRTTAAALGSLMARINTLHMISGAQALGSLVAGLAALGREATRTAEGGRVREALMATRVAVNGEALWSTLGMDAAWSSLPPTPVLEDLRNDLALLLAHDLDSVLSDVDLVEPAEHIGPLREPERSECIDLVVGLWAYSRELVGVVDDLVDRADVARVRQPDPSDLGGPLLR
jgi:hypothetical protein